MRESSEYDAQKINSIIRHILNIKKCFALNGIIDPNNLKHDEISQAACTQFITNIYEAKNKLGEERSNMLNELNKINLSGARNIASHDYDNIDFGIIYSICKKLTASKVLSELYAVLATLEGDGQND
ncbi:MAG: DUF86 domain-containing protein [Firmicutes bacterium]|nr:DUF86 domain-containing protein [Bacillota bacterium]